MNKKLFAFLAFVTLFIGACNPLGTADKVLRDTAHSVSVNCSQTATIGNCNVKLP